MIRTAVLSGIGSLCLVCVWIGNIRHSACQCLFKLLVKGYRTQKAAARKGEGGGYQSIYIHCRLEHEPLNQQAEKPNLSDTDASKRTIHTLIFQRFIVSFSSFHFAIIYCRKLKGVIVSPEI